MIEIDAQELGEIKRILAGIETISKGSMLEQSSKAGNKVRLAVRGEFLRSHTNWVQYYQNGKRKLKKTNIKQTLGKRIAHRNKGGFDDPMNMANFITSFTHQTTGTTVVGGGHRAFRPFIIKDGKIKGRLGTVGATSRQTLAILEKLNYGDDVGKNKDQLFWRAKNGRRSYVSLFHPSTWKPRHFFEKGWNSKKSDVISDMTTRLEVLIGKRANNTDLRKVKDAI
jgi:hypothetical protein